MRLRLCNSIKRYCRLIIHIRGVINLGLRLIICRIFFRIRFILLCRWLYFLGLINFKLSISDKSGCFIGQ
jgi:hypothetical protein